MTSTHEPDSHTRPGASAGLLCLDQDGRVLLVNPTYKPRWNLPGGRIERGEVPSVAAAREAREELGIEVPVGPPLAVGWVTQSERGEQVLFVFDGGVLSPEQQAAIRLQEEELGEHGFFSPEDIGPDLAPPHLLRLLADALRARTTGALALREVRL